MKTIKKNPTLAQVIKEMQKGDKLKVQGYDLQTVRSTVSMINVSQGRKMSVILPERINADYFFVQW